MNNKTYPGMNCNAVEFFICNDDQLKVIENGSVKHFHDLSFYNIEILKDYIKSNKEVNFALHDMHPTSEIRRVEQFAKCRFGGLDFQGDIKDGVLQDGEYWPCPLHDSCPHEGVLCKLPLINDQRLIKQEVQLLQLTATDKTNDVIADMLNICFGTFHLLKKKLYEKLGVQTKQEATVIALENNIR